ncbi:DRBD10 [Trypanosoma brucei gambiense DAL972]|uniref:RNA-binding protein, putative n=2 Tax=Trypanosoma brucei TaxID=5691 RepID=D0AAH4_TRYB9|nr:DRBD10 [Trypanosoma brucei gambiense DAL972]RHW68493.1 RNA-binding protein [Trypanosoma brucei equiperdum]CBH18675.1 DRBD10 [Trypanosoma brucei gambiense DAL972]|eukprot:XP_011780939.1 DRBD10 [Trypanosoma brucei gambiense DAL972]
MAAALLKRKATPSMMRRKKAKQRIRKKLQRKIERKKSNWKVAIAKTYDSGNAKGKKDERFRGKKKRSGDDDETHSTPEDVEEEVQSDIDEEKQERLNKQDPLETQLFLKRLPLDTSEEELLNFFQTRFGGVRRVLLVRNSRTKTLAGTGFIHCGTVEMADKIFDHAQQNARELSANDRADWCEQTKDLSHCRAKRLLFKNRADAFNSREPFMTLRETRFTVHRVLSRKDSHDATAAQQKKKKRTKVAADDPRHLYLLQEGLILPDTPAARGLHPRYIEMIRADYESRKNQLRDSNMFVSTTRLSVRNLPRTMGEKELRLLFSTHVRSFLKKNKNFADKSNWGKYGPIKNVKIVKDSAGTSKGYAFVELVNHPVALHALRALNNNPTIFGDHRRLLVSFAIEDINALQKLKRIRELRRQRDAALLNKSSNNEAN